MNLCSEKDKKKSITCEFHFHVELIEIVHAKQPFPFNIVPSEVEKIGLIFVQFAETKRSDKCTLCAHAENSHKIKRDATKHFEPRL